MFPWSGKFRFPGKSLRRFCLAVRAPMAPAARGKPIMGWSGIGCEADMSHFSFKALALGLLALLPECAIAGAGCCSWHGGESGLCARDGREICNDGTVSPSCPCSGRYGSAQRRYRNDSVPGRFFEAPRRSGGWTSPYGERFYSYPGSSGTGNAAAFPPRQYRAPRRSGAGGTAPGCGQGFSYGAGESSIRSASCGGHGSPSGFCYAGSGQICGDGTVDSDHSCGYSDMRLPPEIIRESGGSWRFVLDSATGFSTNIGNPVRNFAGRYFLFSYSLGTQSASWAMADLSSGTLSYAPGDAFAYSPDFSKPLPVKDGSGKIHQCYYAIELSPDPVSPYVTAKRSLSGPADLSDGSSFCWSDQCWSGRYVLRDGKFVPEDPGSPFTAGCSGRASY